MLKGGLEVYKAMLAAAREEVSRGGDDARDKLGNGVRGIERRIGRFGKQIVREGESLRGGETWVLVGKGGGDKSEEGVGCCGGTEAEAEAEAEGGRVWGGLSE